MIAAKVPHKISGSALRHPSSQIDADVPATLDAVYGAWVAADEAWMAALRQAFPRKRNIGDLRYTDAGKGEVGTPLRKAFDAFVRAGSAWREAKNADLPTLYF
jgi:hypothetical protein